MYLLVSLQVSIMGLVVHSLALIVSSYYLCDLQVPFFLLTWALSFTSEASSQCLVILRCQLAFRSEALAPGCGAVVGWGLMTGGHGAADAEGAGCVTGDPKSVCPPLLWHLSSSGDESFNIQRSGDAPGCRGARSREDGEPGGGRGGGPAFGHVQCAWLTPCFHSGILLPPSPYPPG